MIVSAIVPVEGDADANRLVVCIDRTIRICLGLDNHQLTGSEGTPDIELGESRRSIVGSSIDMKLP